MTLFNDQQYQVYKRKTFNATNSSLKIYSDTCKRSFIIKKGVSKS